MADVEVLPLPYGEASSFGDYEVHDNEAMIDYARANMEPLIAEIEALRAEVDQYKRRAKTHPAITHCDNCGCDWLDNGLNPAACPYCKQPAADKIAAAFRYESNGIVGYVDAPIHSVNMHDDGVVEVVIDYWPEQLSAGDATRWIKENGNG